PINVPTAGAHAFPMDGIGRLGHDPPRGPSADWWMLTTANAAGTNSLTCHPKHGGARDSKFLVTHPMTDHCEKFYSIPLKFDLLLLQSKQRASIKWLLSKAFNNRVPENLLEPFYRDHEDQEHLKPPIVGGLANAELYCLALANMYSDPNYHSLNHWNILQTLACKGVHVPDSPDCALTETVLIQSNPLKIVSIPFIYYVGV
ncbi:hypothetical protein evm_015024, partial [Chilo suppressalis]